MNRATTAGDRPPANAAPSAPEAIAAGLTAVPVRTGPGDRRSAPGQPPAVPAPAPTPAVRLANVTQRFGRGPCVLDAVDLTVAAGEFVCLVGASGCGKSTLLGIIAGLVRPTAGTVETPGGVPALLFQEPALFPWLSAGGNIELALRLRGVARSERRAEVGRLLDLVRLPGARDQRVHQLSGGMRQRVALARALAQSSRVLLMDEPFAAVDAVTRDVLHEELLRIRDAAPEPPTVVFVTHDVREAVRLGGRVLLLSSRPGRIVARWPVEIRHPRRMEDADVAALSSEISARLRTEIRRHSGG